MKKRSKDIILLSVFISTIITFLFGCRVDDNSRSDTTSIPAEDEFYIEECRGLNSVDQDCYYRYRYDPEQYNSDAGYSKLVIYFSGGGMKCDESFGDESANYSKILKGFSDDGYIAVCAGMYVEGHQNDDVRRIPRHEEKDRIHELIASIRESEAIQELWDGSRLLIAGVSNGATVPVVVMARHDIDDSAEWKGSQTTAACFYDGIYDVIEVDDKLKRYPISCRGVRNASICSRYTGAADCPDGPDPNNPDVILDSVTTVDPSEYAVTDWKIVECGSNLPAPICGTIGDWDRDWITKGPMESLCDQIDSGANHNCTLDPLPDQGHLSCAASDSGIDKCRLWFNNL
jgi:hypothetical protein